MPANQRIGMIGKGNVGSALTRGLERAGYKVEAVGKEPRRVRQVAAGADIIVLAVPFAERENAIEVMGDAVEGKTLVDVTNAIDEDMDFAHDLSRSGAEELQEIAPGARIVKAFNTVFAQNMSKGEVKGEPLSLLVAGDDEEAKKTVIELGQDLGFEAVDAGPLENARYLETLGFLNMQLGYAQNLGTDIGFRLVGAPTSARGRSRTARPRAQRSSRRTAPRGTARKPAQRGRPQ